jgi:hypothetical protein
MEYIDVTWTHQYPSEPVRIVTEIDADRWETRKLEFFADGRVGWASGDASRYDTTLDEEQMPALREINAASQFEAVAMDVVEFEALWLEHAIPGEDDEEEEPEDD